MSNRSSLERKNKLIGWRLKPTTVNNFTGKRIRPTHSPKIDELRKSLIPYNDSPETEINGVFLLRSPNRPTKNDSLLTRNASVPLIEFSPVRVKKSKRSTRFEVLDFNENILQRRS